MTERGPQSSKRWLAHEARSPRTAAVIGLLFLGGAITSALAGNLIPALIQCAGVILAAAAYIRARSAPRSGSGK